MPTARDRPPEEASEDSSFARGLRVLLTIADRGEIRADELGTLLEIPVSTLYRYLRTLADFGFVDRQGATYQIGPRLLIGSGASVTAEELIQAADPVLRLLAEETGETAVIVRRIGLSAVCLHEVPSNRPLRVTIAGATGLPLSLGALGRTLLAFAPAEILDEVLAIDGDATADRASEGAKGEGAKGEGADRLRAELAEIVTSGVARSVGEVVSGTVAIAAPILREDGIVAAIGVLGPEGRCDLAWRTRAARLLPGAASTVVRTLEAGPSGHASRHTGLNDPGI